MHSNCKPSFLASRSHDRLCGAAYLSAALVRDNPQSEWNRRSQPMSTIATSPSVRRDVRYAGCRTGGGAEGPSRNALRPQRCWRCDPCDHEGSRPRSLHGDRGQDRRPRACGAPRLGRWSAIGRVARAGHSRGSRSATVSQPISCRPVAGRATTWTGSRFARSRSGTSATGPRRSSACRGGVIPTGRAATSSRPECQKPIAAALCTVV